MYQKKSYNPLIITVINVAIVGHANSGKSTIIGHLLYKLGFISDRTLDHTKKSALDFGKYSWLCDRSWEERFRGNLQYITNNWNKIITIIKKIMFPS